LPDSILDGFPHASYSPLPIYVSLINYIQ